MVRGALLFMGWCGLEPASHELSAAEPSRRSSEAGDSAWQRTAQTVSYSQIGYVTLIKCAELHGKALRGETV